MIFWSGFDQPQRLWVGVWEIISEGAKGKQKSPKMAGSRSTKHENANSYLSAFYSKLHLELRQKQIYWFHIEFLLVLQKHKSFTD